MPKPISSSELYVFCFHIYSRKRRGLKTKLCYKLIYHRISNFWISISDVYTHLVGYICRFCLCYVISYLYCHLCFHEVDICSTIIHYLHIDLPFLRRPSFFSVYFLINRTFKYVRLSGISCIRMRGW